MENNNTDFEIGDVENFINNKDETFNHGQLVMTGMKNVIAAGNKEMVAGWTDKKGDKHGNIMEIYHEDTRRVFISCVQTLQLIMICDFDEEAHKNINALLSSLETKKEEHLKTQELIWNKLSFPEKEHLTKKGEPHIKGVLTNPLLKDDLTEFQLNVYRKIFAELSLLTKRLDFYKADSFEN